MRQDDREPFVRALQRARVSAYAPGEFVEQEGFMRAGEIRALADRAGVARGVSVLDLCCGVAGPGRFITEKLGCTYLGMDWSSSALDIARERSCELACRFEVARIPPLPPGPFDVVLLFETMLAFPEKETLLQEIARALTTGGVTMVVFDAAQRAGLPKMHAHRLRHTAATAMQGRGVASDASFPGKSEDGAGRDTEPCLPTAACSAWRETTGQHGRVGTRLRQTARCGISFCNAA